MENIRKIWKMKKYSDFKEIRTSDIQEHHGLGNESFIRFSNLQLLNPPLYIHMCGITPPTKDYYIKRFPLTTNVLEYVVSGEGHVIVNGIQHKVSAGQCYLLKRGENAEYYADSLNPFQKLWVNFNGSFASQIIVQYNINDTVYKNVDLSDLFQQLFDLEHSATDLSDTQFELSQKKFLTPHALLH